MLYLKAGIRGQGLGSVGVHHLAVLSWPAVRALAEQGPVAILPLGAIEAHGPHLPLGTDVVIAEAMARAGAERLSVRGYEVMILPALQFAPAPFAAAFAGTIDTAAEATVFMIEGVARSLVRHGVRAIVVANAHHDPAHVGAIRSAVQHLEHEQVSLIFPDLTRRRWASLLTDEFRSGACHAGRYETSIVLAEAPGQVAVQAMATLAANPRSLVTAIQHGQHSFEEAGGPNAYFGAPAEATAAEGREIIERLGRIIEEAVVEVIEIDANRQPR
jgi:creatinine amidohydrolase